MLDSCYFNDTEDIDFSELEIENNISHNKNLIENNKNILNAYRTEYTASLKKDYDADEILFEYIDDLILESEDKEKLIRVLDSL